MSLRELHVLVKGLPPEGTALARAMGGDQAIWTTQDWLLASIAEAVREHVWAFESVHSEKGKRPPRPHPVPTPGQPERGRREASHDETIAFFALVQTGGGRG